LTAIRIEKAIRTSCQINLNIPKVINVKLLAYASIDPRLIDVNDD